MSIYKNSLSVNIKSLGQKNSVGFTMVELVVVITTIAILAAISVVSYGNWQKSVITTQLKSDLSVVASAMEDYRTFNNNYPSSIPTTFTPSDGVNLSVSSDGKLYCIDAASSKDSTLFYYIDESIGGQGARLGTCASRPAVPTNLIATVLSNSSISLTWDASTSADTYTLQQAATSSFINPSTLVTQAGTSFTSNGLASSTKYYYRVKATVADVDSIWSDSANNTTVTPPSTPAIPTIAVVLNGANVTATITPVAACTTGVLQYGINSRLNDGSWAGWSTWSSTLTASQTANDGVKYGYQARTRCYLDPVSSAISVGAETTYTDPISIPAVPTVAVSTVGATTTFSWGATSCSAGNTARYQYRYTISPSGYNSGLIATASTSVAFTTSTQGQTYTVQAQAECYSAFTASGMSTAGSASYYRIITYTLTIAAGAGGTVNAGGTYNENTVQTITATPSANYAFSSWSGSTGCSGVASHTITMDANKSCTASFLYYIVDSYSESNQTNYFGIYGSRIAIAQSFTGNGGILSSAKFYLSKDGSPTGNAYVKIYAHTGEFGVGGIPTGSVLATSDAFNPAILTTSLALTAFTFSGQNRITLVNGTKYVISIEHIGGAITNDIQVGTDITTPTHTGNYSYYTTSWFANSAYDVCFYVYSS